MKIKTFLLRGLPEGLLGKSEVQANSFSDLLNKHPELDQIKDRLKLSQIYGGGKRRNLVGAYDACDG